MSDKPNSGTFDKALTGLNGKADDLHILLLELAGKIEYHLLDTNLKRAEINGLGAENMRLASRVRQLGEELEQLRVEHASYQAVEA